jgi:hypothetical protein
VAKIKYDVSDVPETSNAPVGTYRAKIASAEDGESKSSGNPMTTVVFNLTHHADGKKVSEDYWPVRLYLMTEDERAYARRQIKEFVEALGMKAKGTLDTAKLAGKVVQLRLKADTDQDGEYQPRIAKVMALAAAEEAEPEDDEAEDVAEPEEPETEEEEDDEEGVDLDELDRKQLKALIKEEGLEITVLKSMSDDDIRTAIADAFGGDDEEPEDDEEEEGEEPEDDDGEEEEEEGDNYDDLSLTDLKAEVKERELDTAPFKGLKGAKLKAAIVAALREDDGDEPF